MERSEYFLLNSTHILQQSFPQSSSGDNVVVSVYDLDDSNLDVNESAMTFVTGETWKYSWSAPNQTNTYLITFENKTLQVKYFLYARLVGSIIGAPSGSTQGDTLTTLRKEFLLSIDQWNPDENLTADGTSGDQAKRCINLALKKIYGELKDTKFMQSNPSSLASVASQDYIELSGISDLDDVASITETTNNLKLVCIPFWKYREIAPDPSEVTGTPTHYARLFNRIYLTPQPTDAITYTVDYIKSIAALSAESDRAGIPSDYNYWIFAEATVFWQMMEDRNNSAGLQAALLHAGNMKETALRSISAQFDEDSVSESHWNQGDSQRCVPQFDSPVG